ncbi:MAG: 3-dehydroquinate synthase [Anaerolineae bacterium]|nr:3-dehydroquinate synthase [Anaerolineae bacterium]
MAMVDTKHLAVDGENGTYPVIIGPGALDNTLLHLAAERGFSRVAVITNTTLAPLYGQALADKLPGGFLVAVPDGEQYKTLDTVRTLYGDLLAGGADRASLVIGLGGGVIGDTAGFVAATFMRGIAFVQAPTSLLAMVDASIGGKVGVDLPQGKNLVGAFKDPLAVFADTTTLHTLPDIERRCGLAEVVKSALVGDPALLDHLEQVGPEPITDVIAQTAAVKIGLVEQDRLESGPRAFLNLGHTFGHALEHASGYAWKHGAAVAVGLMAAARLSVRLELCDPTLAGRIERVLTGLGLPVRYSGYAPDVLWDTMRHDKKWRGGAATFVLLEGTGQPVISHDVVQADVIDVLDSLREDT